MNGFLECGAAAVRIITGWVAGALVVGELAQLVTLAGEHRQGAASVPGDMDLDVGCVAWGLEDAGDGAAVSWAQPRAGVAGEDQLDPVAEGESGLIGWVGVDVRHIRFACGCGQLWLQTGSWSGGDGWPGRSRRWPRPSSPTVGLG